MSKDRLYIYDTTLRDGQQTQGVQFSLAEKKQIAMALDALGVDYIEGGWPGANPVDSEFFNSKMPLRSTFTAFGMTKRSGRSAENDDVLNAVVNVATPAVCLVGKTHDFHVETALGIALAENTENIARSIEYLVAKGREALFDAEHFFDGYKANPAYAIESLRAAYDAGARWVVLCDTNGGVLPAEVGQIVKEVIAGGIAGDRLGIHTHNDTENAVANTLAAVDAGARQIQGTLNGLGERCGNANLTSLLPILCLKDRGLHASAILKDPTTYEHIDPALVGNQRVIPMSNQAGQSNLRQRLGEAGLVVEKGDPALGRILDLVKTREAEGYSYDTAQASFEVLARRELGLCPEFFDVKRYKVSVERRKNKYNRMVSLSEAVVVVRINGEKKMSVSESMDELGNDRGPVNALSKALAKDLGPYQKMIDDMSLVDYKVRITQGGTEAVTRVVIDCEDSKGRCWSTVGVSANIVDASFEALLDAINWKLIRDTGQRA